jgi:hypothetical protein
MSADEVQPLQGSGDMLRSALAHAGGAMAERQEVPADFFMSIDSPGGHAPGALMEMARSCRQQPSIPLADEFGTG